jgi:U4/U6.U5 tri-snRNP-associated protein 2
LKFDGSTFVEEPLSGVKKSYKLTRLPRYLLIHIKRFSKNEFFVEKNHTIVNFPIKNLDLSDLINSEDSCKYDLLANIIHEGKAEGGTYRV